MVGIDSRLLDGHRDHTSTHDHDHTSTHEKTCAGDLDG